jgi:hypothetical protein
MITKEKVQLVIDNFKKVLPMATLANHLNMNQALVNCFYECGTVHCHAGWYAVAACNLEMDLDYGDGAYKLATDLGFFSSMDLKLWVSNNPELWGNDEGLLMFTDKIAFKSKGRPNGAETLQDIISHWEEVRDRLPY